MLNTTSRLGRIGLLALVAAAPGVRAAKLTPAQIEERLSPIPVFVLTDGAGSPLVANGAFGVFMDPAEAKGFLELMKKQKPELAAKVVITPIPLSEVVSLTVPGSALQPDFVAAKSERDAAAALRVKDSEPLGNAPMFLVRAGAAYLTVTHQGESIIPIFFTKKQADEVVVKYGKSPDATPARVDVTSIEAILNAMLTADDADVAKISLVPSTAMLDAVRTTPPPAGK